MRFDFSPWTRARINVPAPAIRALFPAETRDGTTLSVGRGRSGWGASVVRRGVVLAEAVAHATPMSAVREVARQAAAGIRSLAWCSGCEQPAVVERAGEAWCFAHEPKEQAA